MCSVIGYGVQNFKINILPFVTKFLPSLTSVMNIIKLKHLIWLNWKSLTQNQQFQAPVKSETHKYAERLTSSSVNFFNTNINNKHIFSSTDYGEINLRALCSSLLPRTYKNKWLNSSLCNTIRDKLEI